MKPEVFTPTFIDNCQKSSKCTKCDYAFVLGDSFLDHFIHYHIEYVFNLLSAGEKSLGVQHDKTPDVFKIKEPEIGEPNTPEYESKSFQAPRCDKCHHNDPEYHCVSNDERRIRLSCDYCGDVTIK